MRALASALLALSALGLLFVGRTASADGGSTTGNITVEITDAAKKGVAGIVVVAKVNGTEVKATTGSEQPNDGDLAAAARQGQKAVDALNGKYNARAVLTGVPLGTATITLQDIKGAKPLSASITAEQPTWRLTATVNAKTKKIVGKAKLLFDEVANARAQADAAKAEAAKAKQATDQAKVEQEKARQAQEAARQEQERAKAKQTQADTDTQRARDQAEAERLKRARSEAPSKVSVTHGYCSCEPGQQIKVQCKVKNDAEVPVVVTLDVFAEAGTFGNNANGKAKTQSIAAGTTANFDLMAAMQTTINCKSCRSQKCTITGVTPQ